GPAEKTENWDIYKPAMDRLVYEPDVYIHRNAENLVESILECTPSGYCAKERKSGVWSSSKCYSEEACLSCPKRCQEKSIGTNKLIVQYSFDKKYLDSYFDRHQKILKFLEKHTTTKGAVEE